MIPINQIRQNPKNPRTINQASFTKLVASLSKFPKMMALRPIITDDDGIIIGGNMRYKALVAIGYKELPEDWVKRASDFTEAELKEFVIKDNLGYGEWDWDLLANEWELDQLQDWGLEVPEFAYEKPTAEEDHYEIPDEIKTDIKPGDLFTIGPHRLLCGDSTKSADVQKLMDGREADMVLTDPPYNVALGMNETVVIAKKRNRRTDGLFIMNDQQEDSQFVKFLLDFYKAFGDITKPGGAWYVWHAEQQSLNFRNAWIESGLLLKQCLIWVKNCFVMGRQDYHWQHEPCLYGWKPGAAHYFIDERNKSTVIEDQIDLTKLKKDDMQKMLQEILNDKAKTTVLKHNRPMKNDIHPTMKPIMLLAPLIENSTKEDEIIADAFLGSGSTMVAAHQIRRRCYGMELDPKYCQVIIERMQQLDPEIPITKNGKPLKKQNAKPTEHSKA